MPNVQIGILKKQIINSLNLNIKEAPILIGDQNETHMKTSHPEDYEKYFCDIVKILANPTYVTRHPKGSIEYIKEYVEDGEYILVAVRASGSGVLFARTLFKMTKTKFDKYKQKSVLVKV